MMDVPRLANPLRQQLTDQFTELGRELIAARFGTSGHIHAIVHMPDYMVEKWHGVILVKEVDHSHALVILRKQYRWVEIVGCVLHQTDTLHPCPRCNKQFGIMNFLEFDSYWRIE